MSGKSQRRAAQAQNRTSGGSGNALQQMGGVSNAQAQNALTENNDSLIEALFSNDYVVEPSTTTNVLVQGAAHENNGQLSWRTEWSAPNGFRETNDIQQKGQNINVPFTFAKATEAGELKDGDRVKFTVFAQANGKVDKETREFVMKIPTEELKVWEVFFDSTNASATSAAQTIDPLIFDLNRDGKLDITGANQEGNGKIDGKTVDFDINPERSNISGWKYRSGGHRPGCFSGGRSGNSRAPAVPNGKAVYNTGKEESTNKYGSGKWDMDRNKGTSAEIYNDKNEIVGKWESGYYYWEPTKSSKEEKTEWIKGTGDGFLVWDQNGNGKIDSNSEMMSEFDINGNKVFENGFEKLSHYFDEDGNGIIEGSELEELKFWVDDGDAKTEKGELRELSEFGIQKITIPQNGELESTTTATKEKYLENKKPTNG